MPFVAPVGTRLRCGGSSQRVTGCLAGSKLHVRPYLHESSATEEHLAMPAVKNYRHKADNPAAQQRCEITMEVLPRKEAIDEVSSESLQVRVKAVMTTVWSHVHRTKATRKKQKYSVQFR